MKNIIVKSFAFFTAFCLGIVLANFYLDFDIFPMDEIDVQPLMQNVRDYKPAKSQFYKPNPLLLLVTVDELKNISLNNENLGTPNDLVSLKRTLKSTFYDREMNGVYESDSNKILKRVIIQPKNFLKGKDLFNLVNALENSGASQILIDWNDELNEEGGGGGCGQRLNF